MVTSGASDVDCDGWPLTIDGHAFQRVPATWIEHGVDRDGAGPQCLAVTGTCVRTTILVRYAHPTGGRVGQMRYPSVEGKHGRVPRALVDSEWPRSIAAGTLEPVGELRLGEWHYLQELWSDRVADVLDESTDSTLVHSDGGWLVADGGHWSGDTARDRSGDDEIASRAEGEDDA